MSDLKKGQDILANEVTSEPGISDVGIDIRRADDRNKGAISHGYGRVSDASFHKEKAKNHLKSLVNALKAQPKPNLTKDELEKGDVIDMFPKKTMEHKVNTRAANKMKKDPLHQPETELKNLDDKGHWDKDKGISQAGSDVRHYKRHPDDQAQDKAYGGGAYQSHRRVLAGLKAQPKPNLTKAEVEQFDGKLQKDDHWGNKLKELKGKKDQLHQQKLETHFKAKGQAVPEHLKNPQGSNLNYKNMKQEFNQKANAPLVAPVKPQAKASIVTPASPKHNKLFDPAMSGTVDYKKPMAKTQKASIQPAQTSDPAIINNRISISSPVKISGPAQLDSFNGGKMKKSNDALKKMIGCLTKVDPKTKLPGIMMDKSQDMKKDMNISPAVPMVSKADKDIKGVHKQTTTDSKAAGTSQAGYLIREGSKNKDFQSSFENVAKPHHKQKLQELKDMPKPKLTKADKDIKGVHSNIIHESQASEKGISDAGRNVRNAQKQNEKGQYNTAVSANQTAARFHHKVLNELKAQPKPKLTRAELQKDIPYIPHKDKVKAKTELFNGLHAQHMQRFPDPENIKPENQKTKGNYRRSGARGIAFDPSVKEIKEISSLAGINKPALKDPHRQGDSVIGSEYRQSRPHIIAHQRYEKAGLIDKLKDLVSFKGPFDSDRNKGAEKLTEIRQKRSQQLQELKDMPKPKLTKAELEKFDTDLTKSWGKKSEAKVPAHMKETYGHQPKKLGKASPAPAPAPAQPKPAMPKMNAPKTKMPKPQAPKQPEMQMSEHEKGVHQADYSTQYIKDGKTQHGISSAGIKAREANEPSSFNEYDNSPKVAKEMHKKVLNALKNMKKPNLPK